MKHVDNTIDPGILKNSIKRSKKIADENSFEAVAREWHAKFTPKWSESHGERILIRLEQNIFPWIGKLLCAINDYHGHFVTKCALQLAPLFFVRPGELRHAEWIEFDLDKVEWRIPAEKMKMKEQHIVPLCMQAIQIIRELQAYTGSGKYLFPSLRSTSRPMSENTVLGALR